MIRKHVENDLEKILKIWNESSTLAHPFLHSAFVEKVKTDMRNMYIPDSETWVYENDLGVIGFISMIDDEIGGLFVLPQNHSSGIGTKLVNYVSQYHEKLEVDVFEKNTIGRSFYDKYGFKIIKEYMHEESGEKVLRMSK
jgi:putative acetyltransferase